LSFLPVLPFCNLLVFVACPLILDLLPVLCPEMPVLELIVILPSSLALGFPCTLMLLPEVAVIVCALVFCPASVVSICAASL
jgi:hypothetical protein